MSAPYDAMDVDQLLQFALGYARTGDTTARRLLYERSAEYAAIGALSGAEELVDLDGMNGYLFIAEYRGKEAAANSDFWDDELLLEQLEQKLPPSEIQE